MSNEENPVHNAPLVEAISDQLPGVSTEQVMMVLDAWNTVTTGEPVGTLLRHPETGAIAVRVSANGIHQWQVTNADGGTYIDRTPSLAGWKVLVRPSEGASAP